jgi:hypothetical protein
MKRLIICFFIVTLLFLPRVLTAWTFRYYGDITLESFSYGEHALHVRNTGLFRLTPETSLTAGYGIRFQNSTRHMFRLGISQTVGTYTYIQGDGTFFWVPQITSQLNISLSLHHERNESAAYGTVRTGFSCPGFYAGFAGGGQIDLSRFLTAAGRLYGTYHSGGMLSGALNGEVRIKPGPAVIFTLGGGYRSPQVSLSGGDIIPGEGGVDGYFSGKIIFGEINSLSYVFSLQTYPFYWKHSHSLIFVINSKSR